MVEMSAGQMRDLARAAMVGQGFPEHLVDDVVAEFVLAELSGQRSHGLGKLASLQFGSLEAEPQFAATGAVLAVNGNGGNGFLLMRKVAKRLAGQARDNGVALAAVRNFSRYGALYPYPEMLARNGLVGILCNSAGPAAVTPYGSIDPITGTNPICFSFPTAGQPQTFDFATAERVWGEIRQATLEGGELPDGPFLDTAGAVTTSPREVNAVRAFGGPRGFALNLAIELLAGALVGGRSGLTVASEFDCGALMIAIRPDATAATADFPTAVTHLLDEVRQARPDPAVDAVRSPATGRIPAAAVRAPGDRRWSTPPDRADVAAATVTLLEAMAAGERNTLAADPLLN